MKSWLVFKCNVSANFETSLNSLAITTATTELIYGFDLLLVKEIQKSVSTKKFSLTFRAKKLGFIYITFTKVE